jgi:hypothetical protein
MRLAATVDPEYRASAPGSEGDPIPKIRGQAGGRPRGKRERLGAIADCSAEHFGGESHGGHRANASQRNATGAVCSPNAAALRARGAGIPVKNEVITQIGLTFQAKSPLDNSPPASQPRKGALRLSEGSLEFFPAPPRALGYRGSAVHGAVSAAAVGGFASPAEVSGGTLRDRAQALQ